MSDTRVATRPYIIGPASTSFVVPAASGSLLLDTLSATSILAYSTRKLRSAYAGFAMNVKDAAGLNPLDVGFDGSNNLDTGAISGYTDANVATWYNQATTGVNAIGGTGIVTRNPIIKTGGVLNPGGAPSTGHVWLQGTAAALTFTASVTNINQPYTVAYLGKYTSVGSQNAIGDFNSGNIGFGMNASFFNFNAGAGLPSTVASDTSIHSFFAVGNGASGSITVDGTTTGPSNAGSNNITEMDLWGFATDCLIGEVIFFSGAISGTDQTTIRTSWQSYWGAP